MTAPPVPDPSRPLHAAPAAPPPVSNSGRAGPRPALLIGLGCLGLALPLAAILGAVFVLPKLTGGVEAAQERRAAANLRELSLAQAIYRDGDRDGNGRRDYAPSLEALARAGLLGPSLAPWNEDGYAFVIERADEAAWSATATPLRAGESGQRSLYIDSEGRLRARVPSFPREKARITDPLFDPRGGGE